MLALEGMVLRNLAVAGAARATGTTPHPISPQVALATKKEMVGLGALGMVWEDLMAKLMASDPGLMALAKKPA
jgi:hypothetical protein